MPAIEDHTGLTNQTIAKYARRNFVNISNRKTEYTFFPAIQRNAKKAIANKWAQLNFGLPFETNTDGGTTFKWNVQVTKSDSAQWVSQAAPINVDAVDHQVQATVPWRLARKHWSYNEWEMAAQASDKTRLTSIIVSRMLGCDQGFADFFEEWGWGAPPPSTDKTTAFPLRYWLYTEPESTVGSYSTFTSIVNEGDGNFLNVNHNSYTDGPGGISRATYDMWGNWNCQYTTFSDSDLIEKFTYACMSTHFSSPVDYPNLVKDAPEKAVYTTRGNVIKKGRLARQQNDQNTSDLVARIADAEMFRVPFYAVPHLSSGDFTLYGAARKDPIYMIDWSTFYWVSQNGFQMKAKVFRDDLSAPLDIVPAVWLGGQLVCLEPRRNAVLSL